MNKEYLCPWGGTSKFNYAMPFYDLVAEMTKACVSYFMKVKGIENRELLDAVIGEVTINFPKELKRWLPFYDINNFVYLICRKYFNRELDKNNNYRKHIKLDDVDKLPTDERHVYSYIENLPINKNKKISYKTTSRFDKVDAKKIGPYAYYLGEGCK